MRGVVVALVTALVFMLSACRDESPSSGNNAGSGTSPPPTTPPPAPPVAAPPPPPFTASLDAASLSVSQGSRSGVWVNLTRASGFADDVSVALDTTPSGVDAQAITVRGRVSDGLFTVAATPDLASGSTISLTLVATGGGTTVRMPLTVNVTDPVPTSDSLIAADLAAGKIDCGTSLLYRAYALFHDARLPSQYAGSSSPRNDGLLLEASNPNLPADVQATLAPFLARPTEPESVLHVSAATSGRSSVASTGRVHALADAGESACTLLDGQVERNGWKSGLFSKDGATSVRFWVPCTGDGADDEELSDAATQAAPVIEAETKLMGQPVPDKGGDFFGTDDAIDVYLVDTCTQQVPRNDSDTLCSKREKSTSVVGATVGTYSASTATGNARSAFVIIDRHQLDTDSFKSTFAHEFFHVLENAYNSNILSFVDSTGVFGSEFWYAEAAATWAEAHFVPDTAAEEVHGRFVKHFQPSHDSLHTSQPASADHLYAAYIWPFFYEQKTGDGGASMHAAWNSLRDTEDFAAANQNLAGLYGFQDNFRLFAVENLNFELKGVLDEDKRYVKLDENFPDGQKPNIAETPLAEAGKTSIDLDLEPLRADYFRFPVTGDKVKKVVFHFDKITERDGLDIDGLIKIKGKDWEKRPYSSSSEVKFCLDKPEQALEDSYVVFSNHNVPLDKFVRGLAQVEAIEVPCGGQWGGTAKGEYGVTVSASVTWVRDETRSTDTLQYFYPTGTVDFTAPNCVVTPSLHDIAPAEGGLVIDYSTDPPSYKVQGSTVWQAAWTCGDGGGSIQAGAGGIWLTDSSNPPIATGPVKKDSDGNGTVAGSNSANNTTFTYSFTEQ